MNPITGIAGCCAPAASGQAARRAAEKGDERALVLAVRAGRSVSEEPLPRPRVPQAES